MKNLPIRVFSSTDLSLIAEVDWYEDAYFTRSLTGYGKFSISINYNITNAQLFTKGSMVQFGNSDHRIGFIDEIQKGIDEGGKGSQKLTITGFEAKSVFSRRIVIPASGNDYYIQDAVVETVMKNTVLDQCGASAVTARKFALLNVATDLGRGTSYQLQAFNTSLSDHLTTAAESQSPYIGFEVYFDEVNKKLVFDVIVGKDRRSSQVINPRVCFSSEYDTLKSATITDQYSGFKNVVYVGGQGDGADKTIVKTTETVEATDLVRRETYLDKSNLQTTSALTNAGTSQLNALAQAILTVDAQALVTSQYKIFTDYDIGDLVNIKEYGALFDAQITEAQESWAYGKYEVSLTFGKQAPSIVSMVTATASSLGQSNTSKASIGWKSAYQEYVMTADRTQQYIDIVNDVLILSGTMTSNQTLTLQAPDSAYVGRKQYSILVTATGGKNITITTGVSGKTAIVLVSGTVPYLSQIFVDDTGNVTYIHNPTPGQKAALAGTSGTPSATNPYVTLQGNRKVFASYKMSTSKPSGPTQPIDFNTLVSDTFTAVTTGSAWKFTVPAGHDGVYGITGWHFSGTNNIYVYVNGTNTALVGCSVAGVSGQTFCHHIYLTAGQYIDFRTTNGSTVSVDSLVQICEIGMN